MAKFTPQELERLAQAGPSSAARIRIGMSTCGLAAGAQEVFDVLSAEAAKDKLPVEISKCGCLGMCYAEPVAEVCLPGKPPVVYGRVDKDTALRIIREHVAQGQPVAGRVLDKASGEQRIVLRNCGRIDPDSIEDYIAAGGYLALKKALLEMSPDQVIDQIKKAACAGAAARDFRRDSNGRQPASPPAHANT